MADGFDYIIEQQIAVLSENEKTGWRKELNLISWNGRAAKYDLREWSKDHSKCNKGVTLSEDELRILTRIEI